MKVGIATITYTKEKIPFNYGNVLQNYALTEYLKKIHFEPETIYYLADYYKYGNTKYSFVAPKMKRDINFLQISDDVIRVFRRTLYRNTIRKKTETRNNKFNGFINKNIIYSAEEYDNTSDYSSLCKKYDCFITGSDQVWNPYWEGSNEFFYLSFAPKGKRISYAPSITVDNIPDEIVNDYKQWLDGIDFLSIREEEGRILIKNLFGLQAKWVCDPVFLLDKQEWLKCCVPINQRKYFLVYILGKKTPWMKRRIHFFEKMTGLKALDVYTRDNPDSLFAGPEEFLSLINEAAFLFTDSFHGVAFSLLFDTPFVVEKRNQHDLDIDSRIRSLLDLAGMVNRSTDFLIDNPNLLFSNEIDKTRLYQFISESKDYLLTALQRANNR